MKYIPHQYQDHAYQHLVDHPYAGLFMEMGLGKSIITLSFINWLLYAEMENVKVLIIAPLKVAETTWTDEIEKWDQIKHLTVSLVLDSVKHRLAALAKKADIYIINRENVAWLVTHYQTAWPFKVVVIDELSSFKNPDSQRFKALRMVRPLMNRVIGLTGTPAPNGLHDLWAQLYLIDMGERLGKTITSYRNTYLYAEKSNGHVVYKYAANKENAKRIYALINDVCISMKTKDYLEVPERIDKTVKVKLPEDIRKRYVEFEKTEVLNFLEHESNIEAISAVNAAALMTKLLQFGNGAIYTDKERTAYAEIHDEKIKALEEIIEAAQGEPVLVFYAYQHDYERMKKRLGGKKYQTGDLKDWNAKKIPLMYAHPASVAYGLNMQDGGFIIVWFGQTFSLELWDQANARLCRQGQKHRVLIYKLVCPGTVDVDAARAIEYKSEGQGALMDAVKARISKYTNMQVTGNELIIKIV